MYYNVCRRVIVFGMFSLSVSISIMEQQDFSLVYLEYAWMILFGLICNKSLPLSRPALWGFIQDYS